MPPVSWHDLLAQTTLLPGAARLLELRSGELPQKDELCGPFGAVLALRAAGVRRPPGGGPLDQDVVALAAGTVLSPPPRTGSLPPGQRGRDDYRLTLPEAADPTSAGTSAVGVARAIERLSAGTLAVVPASGQWDPARLRELLGCLAGKLGGDPVTVLANLATGELAEHRTYPAELARYLETGDDQPLPASHWQAGHFVALAGLLDGPAGCLVLVADSYPLLGWDGLHLQPVERLAAALRREGLPPGGLLLVVPAARRDVTQALVSAAGLRPKLWDNGSPDAAGDTLDRRPWRIC